MRYRTIFPPCALVYVGGKIADVCERGEDVVAVGIDGGTTVLAWTAFPFVIARWFAVRSTNAPRLCRVLTEENCEKMQTSTYRVHRDNRGWVVVKEFGRTRKRAGVFSTLVAALEFVGMSRGCRQTHVLRRAQRPRSRPPRGRRWLFQERSAMSIFTPSPCRHAIAVAEMPSQAPGDSLRFELGMAECLVLCRSLLHLAVATCYRFGSKECRGGRRGRDQDRRRLGMRTRRAASPVGRPGLM
jgi:hypothetical protein